MNLRRGRYVVYRVRGNMAFPVARRWRLKAALSVAADVAFDGRGDAQVCWRTGRRTGRAYTLKGIA
jgi:hypothetical protein